MTSHSEFSVSNAFRLLFFLSLFVYVLILLISLPSGAPGLLPAVVLPIIAVLLLYRLLTILFPARIDDLREGISDHLDARSAGMISTDSLIPDESDQGVEDPKPAETARILIWITAGILLIYMFGHFIGGFVFMLPFLYIYGDIDLVRSLTVSVVITLLLWILAASVNLSIWPGKWVEFL